MLMNEYGPIWNNIFKKTLECMAKIPNWPLYDIWEEFKPSEENK